MKKQNIFEIIWEGLTMPFVALSILIDEDMRFNEDGYWNKHFARANKRAAKKEQRRAAKEQAKRESAPAQEATGSGLFSKKQKEDGRKALNNY